MFFKSKYQEKYLHDRIKVKGKAGNLGDSVKISKDKAVVTVTATVPISKRYIKYLTKKFLKKQQLKDYLQVISSSKTGYLVKYYDINQGADEEAADE
jgi:large subunit ribosomal protein L22e